MVSIVVDVYRDMFRSPVKVLQANNMVMFGAAVALHTIDADDAPVLPADDIFAELPAEPV